MVKLTCIRSARTRKNTLAKALNILPPTLAPRGLSRTVAAAYLGVSASLLTKWWKPAGCLAQKPSTADWYGIEYGLINSSKRCQIRKPLTLGTRWRD